MQNSQPDQLITGVIFENQGTADITIDQIHTLLAGGQTIDGAAGISVRAGNSVTYLFDTQAPEQVQSLSFAVHGTTEELVVLTTQQSGLVPQSGDGFAGEGDPCSGALFACLHHCRSGLVCTTATGTDSGVCVRGMARENLACGSEGQPACESPLGDGSYAPYCTGGLNPSLPGCERCGGKGEACCHGVDRGYCLAYGTACGADQTCQPVTCN
jgi:hypothetical protein